MQEIHDETTITNTDLKRALARAVPGASIEAFALTFDGYKAFGDDLSDLLDRQVDAVTVLTDLDEFGGCLFFEQGRWRDSGARVRLEHAELTFLVPLTG